MKNLLHSLADGFVETCHAIFHNRNIFSVMVLGIAFYSVLYPLPYHNETPQKLPLLVVNLDGSTTSRTLLRMLDSTEGVSVAQVFSHAPKALESLREGYGQATLIIPEGFERDVLRGTPSILPIYIDAGYLLAYRVAYRGIKLAVENMGAGVRVEQFQSKGMPELAALSLQVRGQMAVSTLYNPAGNYAMSVIPAVFLLILQQTLFIGGAMIVGTRKPGSGAAWLMGHLAFLVILFILYALYYTWLLPMLYDLPRAGSTGDVLLFLLPFFVACGATGAAVGVVVPKGEYVLAVMLPISLPILFLSGVIWPPEAMPAVMRAVAQIWPSTPAINGYLCMSQRGASLAEMAPLWGHLWGLALIFVGVAWGLMTKRMKRVGEAPPPQAPPAGRSTPCTPIMPRGFGQ